MNEIGKSRLTHLFSAQLADHDSLFSPYKPGMPWRRIAIITTLAIAVVIWGTPSFRLAREVQTKPSFAIADTLQAGELFTVPADPTLFAAHLDGRSLSRIDGPRPIWVGAANSAKTENLEFSITFKAPERKWHPRILVPKFKHPYVPVFAKKIRVEQIQPVVLQKHRVAPRAVASGDDNIEQIAADATLFSRKDGLIRIACWKAPVLKPFEPIQTIARRIRARNTPLERLASVSSAGPGEIAQVNVNGKNEKTIIVYHGGGLYSRYMRILESRVENGEKIKSGQMIGIINAGSWRNPASVEWDLHLDRNQVSEASLLALSTQLCDSK